MPAYIKLIKATTQKRQANIGWGDFMKKSSIYVILMLIASTTLLITSCSSKIKSTTSDPSWSLVQEQKTKHSVFYAGFHDAQFGITVGYGGTTYYTQDGGQNWIKSDNKANCRFGLDILNPDYLWSIGNYGGNRVSTNGGVSLFSVSDLPLIEERPNNLISIIDEKDIWLASPLRLAHTQDGGFTWIDIQLPANCEEMAGLCFYSSLGGYILDSLGTLHQTKDGGQSWANLGKIPTVEGIRQTDVASVSMRIDESGNGNLVYLDNNSLLISFQIQLGAKDPATTFKPIPLPEIKNSAPYLSRDGKWLTVTSTLGNIKVFELKK